MIYLQKLKKIPNTLAIVAIKVYRMIFSPSVGVLRYLPFYPQPVCIFYPTCSEYGIECFKKYNFLKAVFKTLNRIRRCHPGNEPKVDLP